MSTLRATSFGGANGVAVPDDGSVVDDVILVNGGTATLSTTYAAHGSVSAAAVATSSGDQAVMLWQGWNASPLSISAYIYAAAYPSGTTDIITIRNASGNAAKLQLGSDGKLRIQNAASSTVKTYAAAIGTGAWIRVEMTVTKGTTTGDGRIQHAYYSGDSTSATDSYDSGAATNTGTADLTSVRFGWLTGSTTGTLYFDSVQAEDVAFNIGPWVMPGLTIADDSGSTDAGSGLTRSLSLTISDDAGADDTATPDEGVDVGDPPAGGGAAAVLDDAILGGGLVWLYSMQEGSGEVAGDVSGSPGRPNLTMTAAPEEGEYTAEFGAAGVMPEGTAVLFQPAGAGSGRQLVGAAVSAYLGTEFTFFLQFAWTAGAEVQLAQLGVGSGPIMVLSATSTRVTVRLTTSTGAVRSASVAVQTNDNRPHMAVITASGNTLTLLVDSEDLTATTQPADMGRVHGLTVGGLTSTAPHQVAWVGYCNYPMTLADAADLAGLGTGASERTDLRVARICRWVGVDWDLVAEEGLSDVAYQATGGNAALDIIHAAVAGVEDGVFFPSGDGRLMLQSRAHRRNAPVALTLTADEVTADMAVQVDLTRVVNDVTLSRPRGATTRARDESSVSAYGPRSADGTVYAASDDALADIAHWRVLRYGTPTPRIPRCTVDLLPLSTERAAAVLGVKVGDRIQITDMPSTTPGGTTVDLFVEGVSDTISHTEWSVTWSTSPAFAEDIGTLDDTAVLDSFLLAY